MLIVRPLDVGQPLQQPALRDFQGPYINNYPGWYLSVHRIRSKYLSITLESRSGSLFFKTLDAGAANRRIPSWWIYPIFYILGLSICGA